MDGKVILEQFQDNLGPLLDTYEQAIYLYVLSIEKDFWANWISGIALALCNDSRRARDEADLLHPSG